MDVGPVDVRGMRGSLHRNSLVMVEQLFLPHDVSEGKRDSFRKSVADEVLVQVVHLRPPSEEPLVEGMHPIENQMPKNVLGGLILSEKHFTRRVVLEGDEHSAGEVLSISEGVQV